MEGNLSDRADRLTATLNTAFAPEVLCVTDDSAHHAGHVGIQGSAGQGAVGQTHFSVLLVSETFRGMTRVARSRAVHAALAGEFGAVEAGGMHAMALTLRTPEEHRTLERS
ncbi:MAG TPA: BolA family protein [Acetobacteraceae bacterium]|nr:BolA family protein [Acetobacteraceae bacterium]